MKLKKIILGFMAVMSTIILVACGGNSKSVKTIKNIQDKGKLIVALSPDYAPFEFKALIDGKSTIVGADIELAKAIGEKLGVEIELSPMSFNNVLGSLSSGKADIAISGISPTSERTKVYAFSDIYYEAKNIVLIKKDDLSTFKTAGSLKEQSVGAQKGSIQEGLVKEQLVDSHLVSLVQVPEMVNQLKSDKLDAVVIEEAIAKGYVEQNDDLAIAEITFSQDVNEVGSAVAIAKGNDELTDAINEVIKEVKESGQMEKFVQEAYEFSLSNVVEE